jgi:hypothetical protein
MTETYVPAAPGLEAVLLSLCSEYDRPTLEDVNACTCPVVAWQITNYATTVDVGVYPVLACDASVSADWWIAIPMTDGSVCVFHDHKPGGDLLESLDDAKRWMVIAAQGDWNKKHKAA